MRNHVLARLSTLAVVALAISWLVPVSPAAANDAVQGASAAGYDLTAGRAGASSSALIALIGVVFGVTGLVRSRGRNHAGAGLASARMACGAGLISTLVGGFIVSTADGGLGSGSGLAGAIVAVALGVIGVMLGALVIIRTGSRARNPNLAANQAPDRQNVRDGGSATWKNGYGR